MSVSGSELVDAVAAGLRRARIDAQPVAPVREQLGRGGIAAAYAVQEAITCADLAEGRRLVGRKIGLTSKAVQRQLGVDQPDYGMLFADMNREEQTPIDLSELIAPRIEAEIAFVMGRALDVERPTVADVIGAVDYMLPAFEIVDSRVRDWDISIIDTVADNASSGLFVLGTTPVRLSAEDLSLAGMVLEVDGEPVAFGAGAACLGHPLTAVRWLAARMAQLGRPLGAGDIVLSGALGPMVPARAGAQCEARILGVGSVRASFGGVQ